jgi:hypothetical protein
VPFKLRAVPRWGRCYRLFVIRRTGLALGGAGAVLGLVLLTGCGGGGGQAARTTPGGPDAPIQASDLVAQADRTDPDQGPKMTSDLYTYVTPLGGDRYRLEVTNTGSRGFINKFTWFPGPGTTVVAVTSTRVDRGGKGACRLEAGKISCDLSLRPPTCTCRGDGGTVAVGFTAKNGASGRTGSTTFGGRVFVEAETLVPYHIPSSPDQKPSDLADLPMCAEDQASTAEKPCQSSR